MRQHNFGTQAQRNSNKHQLVATLCRGNAQAELELQLLLKLDRKPLHTRRGYARHA